MPFLYEVTTPPEGDPVTLQEAKLFLRVDNPVDDTLIGALVSAATLQGEAYSNRVFVTRDLRLSIDSLCSGGRFPYIEIARSPLTVLTSVKYVSGGVLVDLPVEDYELQKTNGFSRLLLLSVPVVDADAAYPFVIEFTAGYGVPSSVPEDIKTAIKEHVNFLYENRGDVQAIGKESMPITTEMIYRTGHRIVATY
jgi:uncharacterized phiE125 gp8 family phage protein